MSRDYPATKKARERGLRIEEMVALERVEPIPTATFRPVESVPCEPEPASEPAYEPAPEPAHEVSTCLTTALPLSEAEPDELAMASLIELNTATSTRKWFNMSLQTYVYIEGGRLSYGTNYRLYSYMLDEGGFTKSFILHRFNGKSPWAAPLLRLLLRYFQKDAQAFLTFLDKCYTPSELVVVRSLKDMVNTGLLYVPVDERARRLELACRVLRGEDVLAKG